MIYLDAACDAGAPLTTAQRKRMQWKSASWCCFGISSPWYPTLTHKISFSLFVTYSYNIKKHIARAGRSCGIRNARPLSERLAFFAVRYSPGNIYGRSSVLHNELKTVGCSAFLIGTKAAGLHSSSSSVALPNAGICMASVSADSPS